MRGCRVLNDKEIKLILNNSKIRERTLYLTGLMFGTRVSESSVHPALLTV
jgi:hypothetical protein